MADLGIGFDKPNPYGLRASDFDHDMEAYDAALRFLGDLVSGSDEPAALEANGIEGTTMRGWLRSPRFRRVLDKCRGAGQRSRDDEAPSSEASGRPVAAYHPSFVPWDKVPPGRMVGPAGIP